MSLWRCSRQMRHLGRRSPFINRAFSTRTRPNLLRRHNPVALRLIYQTGRPRCLSAKPFRGVTQRDDGRWDSHIVIDGDKHHIGTFDLDFQAARAYDEWLSLLSDGNAAPESETNFTQGTEWVPIQSKEVAAEVDELFETRRGEPFNVAELVSSLKKMNAQNINVIDLEGKTTLAEHFIFVTGKSVAHMRKMMDTILVALKRRRLPALKKRRAMVEGRDCDDWMLVDCENIVVHAFDTSGRKEYDLDNFWGKDRIKDRAPGSHPGGPPL